MEPKEHTLKVNRRAHYYTNEGDIKTASTVWIVAHGYGQIASRIIKKFDVLDPSEHLVIAPEALSLFYWGGVTGDYAASWMTSKNRLDEIEDYCDYLDQVYNKYLSDNSEVKVIFFGFSQGATTMYRWVEARKRRFDVFVNWAGWFADDLEMNKVSDLFSQHYIVYGNEDQFISEERSTQLKELLSGQGYYPEVMIFEGKHEVSREALSKLLKKLEL